MDVFLLIELFSFCGGLKQAESFHNMNMRGTRDLILILHRCQVSASKCIKAESVKSFGDSKRLCKQWAERVHSIDL